MMARESVEAVISAIGSKGDGIAETPAGRVHVPFTVPGDRLRLLVPGGEVVERLSDGPARIAPPCPHFTVCGGCALQHLRDADYVAWKRDRVVAALDRRGLAAEVAAPVRIPPAARRRVRLGARRTRDGVILGFKQRQSHRLVDVAECPVCLPEIVAALPGLRRALAASMPAGAGAEVSVTALAGGLDVVVDSRAPLDLDARQALARYAEDADLARLSWGADPVVQRRPAQVTFSGIAVDLPPGAFLQPTEGGAAALGTVVEDALADAQTVADLHAGCGAFTFALAVAGRQVHAADADAAQIAALDAARRRAGPSLRLSAECRDLRRRPLAGAELDRLDGVVLDPPRAGAAEQAAVLAESVVPAIAYVSCNPATFARDARILVDGGYRLGLVTPVDQFLWSPHVELAAVFRK